MANESYDDYLATLGLGVTAGEEEIRIAVVAEQRKWNQRLTAPQIERRQEADRRMKALAEAERVLLGPEGSAVRRVRQGAAPGRASAAPVSQAYRYHLQLLSLAPSATEDQIRSALAVEQRRWMERTNSPAIEVRHEAERRIHALDEAERVLLSGEGASFRRAGSGSAPPVDSVVPTVDAETIARAIERIAIARGAKSQEREGTAVHKSATVFHKGVDYRLDELIHKKFEAIKDARTLTARRGGVKLFEWFLSPVDPPGQPSVRVNTAGAWTHEIVALAATLEAR
jgi:hypothetical protein